jgi:hypothetical protein
MRGARLEQRLFAGAGFLDDPIGMQAGDVLARHQPRNAAVIDYQDGFGLCHLYLRRSFFMLCMETILAYPGGQLATIVTLVRVCDTGAILILSERNFLG